MALIDGVKDRFINSLTNTPSHSHSKRTFKISTDVVYELLQEFLDDYLDLYIPKNQLSNIHNVRSYLAVYLFTDKSIEEVIDEYNITKKEFDAAYTSMYKGFKVLYEEDYM